MNERVPGLNLGLPTEAEWEYACRGGTDTPRYVEDVDCEALGWVWENSEENGKRQTHPVKQKIPNCHGLYDMLGNVWEWCRDNWRDVYSGDTEIDPLHESGNASARRVVRGGSWGGGARFVRAAFRGRVSPEYRDDYIGFRCRVQPGELRPAEQVGEGGARLSGEAEGRSPGEASETSSDTRAEGSAEISSTWVNLVDRDSDTIPIPQSPRIRVISDVEEITLQKTPRPDWATAMGRDRYGLWSEFEIPRRSKDMKNGGLRRSRTPYRRHDVVVQRLRWVPPGSFQFGSPKSEAGRWDDGEFEATTEVVKEGFWIFDTPVTQELWESVMGDNPSEFVSPTRPVEHVSWKDCQEFLTRFGKEQDAVNLPGLDLLTEREWECACRAGTTDATYAGPVEYIGDGNAPALDDIAIYSGNCGVDWDLAEDVALEPWPDELQYDFRKGGTRPVGKKQPNTLGLYDMLGNVYEWCEDAWRAPGNDATPEEDYASADRVVRGGSWVNDARYVRAAYRDWFSPGSRSDFIGFRCRVRELRAAEQQGEGGVRSSGEAGGRSPGEASETSSDTRAEGSAENRDS